jgi:hypothetical protein
MVQTYCWILGGVGEQFHEMLRMSVGVPCAAARSADDERG